MDTRHLSYVIEIYDLGSINKAANKLDMSQSNLSVCIKNLENELGFNIFNRNPSGISPTPEGHLFIDSVKSILKQLETIKNIPSILKTKDNISISCTYSFDLMNTFIKFISNSSPSICEDSLKETGLIQTVRDVIEKKYRMTFFYCFEDISNVYYKLAKDYNLKIMPIARRCPLILLASKNNKIAKRKSIEFDEIKSFKFIMYENFLFEEWLKILGFEDDSQILYVFDRGGLIDTIKQSNYVTVMMKMYTKINNEDCVEIPIVNSPSLMNAYVMYPKDYILNNRERKFLRDLKGIFYK